MSMKFMAAALAAVGIVGGAIAQTDSTRIDATPSFLTFRGGLVFPLDNNLREASDLFAGIGIDYEFPTQLIKGSTTYASVDWWLRASNGSNGNVFPIAINQRFYSKGSGTSMYDEGRTYFFVGAGVAIIDIASKSTGKWMVRGGVGAEIGPNVIAEGVITFSDESSTKVRANGIGVYLGYKF